MNSPDLAPDDDTASPRHGIDPVVLNALPPAFGFAPDIADSTWSRRQDWHRIELHATPPAALIDLHDPLTFDRLWKRLLAVVRVPVRSVEAGGVQHLLICGSIVVRVLPDGTLDVHRWTVTTPGLPTLEPHPNVTVLGTPWRNNWLQALAHQAAPELAAALDRLDHQAGPSGRNTAERLAADRVLAYAQWAFAVFGRRLRRHADLRHMRQRVAQALALDPWALLQASRLPRVEDPESWVSAQAYNRVLRHASAIRTLNREADHLVPLFGALCDEPGFPDHGEAVWRLKHHLEARIPHLRPRQWRWIVQCGPRLLRPLAEFYQGDVGAATIEHLALLCHLADAQEPPAWLVRALLTAQGNRLQRSESHVYPYRCGEAVWKRITHLLSAVTIPSPELLADVGRVQDWLFSADFLLSFTKNQRRQGWAYWVKRACTWTDDRDRRLRGMVDPWWAPFDSQPVGAWTVTSLCTPWSLWEEGQILRHCVATFAYNCEEKHALVFSIQAGPRRVATLMLHWSPDPASTSTGHWALWQLRGFANASVPAAMERAMRAWLAQAPWRTQPSEGILVRPPSLAEVAQAETEASLFDAVVDAAHADQPVAPDLCNAITAWLDAQHQAGKLSGDLGGEVVVARDRVRDWTRVADRAWEWIAHAGDRQALSRSAVERSKDVRDAVSALTEVERRAVDRVFVEALLARAGLQGDGYGFWAAKRLDARDGRRAWVVYRLTGDSFLKTHVELLGFCVDPQQVWTLVDRHGWTLRTIQAWSADP